MKTRHATMTILLTAFALGLPAAPPAGATEDFSAPLLQAGEDERVDAGGVCPSEPDFVAGTVSTACCIRWMSLPSSTGCRLPSSRVSR